MIKTEYIRTGKRAVAVFQPVCAWYNDHLANCWVTSGVIPTQRGMLAFSSNKIRKKSNISIF